MPVIMRVGGGAGGSGQKTVTINAPKNSTVSWTGVESGSVAMGSQTQATVALQAGTYTFTNTLTIDGTVTTIYTKTAAITADTTVNVFPDGALYWYGMFLEPFVPVSSLSEDNVTYSENSLYIYLSKKGSFTGQYLTNNTISLLSYSAIKITAHTSSNNNWKLAITTSKGGVSKVTGLSASWTTSTMNIASDDNSYFVGVSDIVSGATSYYGAGVYIRALWLE